MDTHQIRQEFNARYFHWAQLRAEHEIVSSFPSLQSFKSGMTSKMFAFMRHLAPNFQRTYASALLKHYHANAAKAQGVKLSTDEEILLTQGWSFSPPHPARENEIELRREAGHKTKFASKRILRASMTTKFREAFGDHCVGLEGVEREPDLRFRMKVDTWIVQTNFQFGRQRTIMSYDHLIASERRISHPKHSEITAPAMIVTIICWIGLFPIEWQHVFEDEVGEVCDAVIEQSSQVLQQLPTMLNGLSE